MKRERPFPIGDVAAFHYTAHLDRERFTAGIALVEARTMRFASQLSGDLPRCSAVRADRTVRPPDRLEMPASFVLVAENRIGKAESLGHGLTP